MSTIIGTIAEKKFALKALESDCCIYEPVVDRDGCDFVVQKGADLVKVQVKSTVKRSTRGDWYRIGVKCGSNCEKYTKDSFDYLAVYIYERNLWYIIPFNELTGKTLRLDPDRVENKYNKYKEAWGLVF